MRAALALVFILACAGACSSFTDADTDGPATDATDGGGAGDAQSGGDADASNAVDASDAPARMAVVLAASQDEPISIAADDATVYWAENVAGAIRRVPLAGGATKDVQSYGGAPIRIIVTPTSLFWSDQNVTHQGLYRLVEGGNAQRFYTGSVFNFDVVPSGFAVGSVADDTFRYVGDDGSVLGEVQTGQTSMHDLVADGNDALWVASGLASIFRSTGPSATPQAIVTGESDCRSLAVNARGIYWTRHGDSLVRWRDRQGLITTIATNQVAPFGLVADASGVYWITDEGALHRWTEAGGVETLAQGFTTPADTQNRGRHHCAALTSKHVVWITAHEIMRVEK